MSRDDLHYRVARRAYASFNSGLTRRCDYCQCMGHVQGEITSRFGTQGAEFGPLVAHPPRINRQVENVFMCAAIWCYTII